MERHDRFELYRLRLADTTVQSYNSAINEFLQWLPNNTIPSWKELDHLVTDFANFIYREYNGKRRSMVECLRYGLEFYFPETKGCFVITDKSLAGWKKVTPVTLKTVCPRPVAFGIAHKLLFMGYPDVAVAVLLTFDCYLRSADITSARTSHVQIAQINNRLSGVLILPKTKRGLNQSAIIRPYFLIVLLQRLIARKKTLNTIDEDPKLFAFSPTTFRNRIKAAADAMNLSHLKITPHSLRYGGASQDFVDQVLPRDEIKARGRWSAEESVNRYLQAGRLLTQVHKIPSSTFAFLQRLINNPYQYFNVPPPEQS